LRDRLATELDLDGLELFIMGGCPAFTLIFQDSSFEVDLIMGENVRMGFIGKWA